MGGGREMDKKIAYERALFAFWAETLQKIVPDDPAAKRIWSSGT